MVKKFARKAMWAALVDIAPLIFAIIFLSTMIPFYASLIPRREFFHFPNFAITSITAFYGGLYKSIGVRGIDALT